jgi:hypothetical protein
MMIMFTDRMSQRFFEQNFVKQLSLSELCSQLLINEMAALLSCCVLVILVTYVISQSEQAETSSHCHGLQACYFDAIRQFPFHC